MLTEEKVLAILRERNVLMNGHFVLTSGLHSDAFVNLKLGLYPYPTDLATISQWLAEMACDLWPDGFISPVIGGTALGNLTVKLYREITPFRPPNLYANKSFIGEHVIRRGFDKLLKGRRILVVDDNFNLGRSGNILAAVQACEGRTVGCVYVFGRNHSLGIALDTPNLIGIDGADRIDWTCPPVIAEYAATIANICRHWNVEAVVGPAVHGAILAQQVAARLAHINPSVVCAFTEQDVSEDRLFIPDPFIRMTRGRRIAIVEDVVTTGKSIVRVAELVRECGGDVAGALAICIRGPTTADALGIPTLRALVEMRALNAWEESACPLCANGTPVNTDAGHGREFLAKRAPARAT